MHVLKIILIHIYVFMCICTYIYMYKYHHPMNISAMNEIESSSNIVQLIPPANSQIYIHIYVYAYVYV
jgi:hypothetical protein